MTTKAHSTLTGADLHEPKGVAAAAANKVYVTDGAGSGTFKTFATSPVRAYGGVDAAGNLAGGSSGITSVARVSLGVYNVTLSTAVTGPVPLITPWGSPGESVCGYASVVSSTLIQVSLFIPSTSAVDRSFSIAVLGV